MNNLAIVRVAVCRVEAFAHALHNQAMHQDILSLTHELQSEIGLY